MNGKRGALVLSRLTSGLRLSFRAFQRGRRPERGFLLAAGWAPLFKGGAMSPLNDQTDISAKKLFPAVNVKLKFSAIVWPMSASDSRPSRSTARELFP